MKEWPRKAVEVFLFGFGTTWQGEGEKKTLIEMNTQPTPPPPLTVGTLIALTGWGPPGGPFWEYRACGPASMLTFDPHGHLRRSVVLKNITPHPTFSSRATGKQVGLWGQMEGESHGCLARWRYDTPSWAKLLASTIKHRFCRLIRRCLKSAASVVHHTATRQMLPAPTEVLRLTAVA